MKRTTFAYTFQPRQAGKSEALRQWLERRPGCPDVAERAGYCCPAGVTCASLPICRARVAAREPKP
jgi:hypothetical protein